MAKKKASKKASVKVTKKQVETIHIDNTPSLEETLSSFGKWVVRSWNRFYSLLRNGK